MSMYGHVTRDGHSINIRALRHPGATDSQVHWGKAALAEPRRRVRAALLRLGATDAVAEAQLTVIRGTFPSATAAEQALADAEQAVNNALQNVTVG